MSLRWKEMEARIQQAVRSRSGRRRWSSARFSLRHGQTGPGVVGLAYLGFLSIGALANLFSSEIPPARVLAAMALASCGFVLILSGGFTELLASSRERTVAVYLPISNDEFFDFAMARTLWRCAMLLAPWTLGCAYAALKTKNSVPAIVFTTAAGCLGVLQAIALGVMVVARPALQAGKWIIAACFVLALVMFFVPPLAAGILQTGAFLLPPGWIALAVAYGVAGRHPVALLSLLPAAALFVFAWRDYRKIRAIYRDADFQVGASPFDGLDSQVVPESAGPEEEREPVEPTWFDMRNEFQVLRMREALLATRLLDPGDWSTRGWVEALVGRWLTPREKTLAEFFLGGGPGSGWTDQWLLRAKWALPATVFALPFVPLPGWVAICASLVAVLSGAGLLIGSWPGFLAGWSSGLLLPVFAPLPVGYWEVSRMMMKVSLVRVAAWLPILLLGSTLFWLQVSLSLPDALLVSLFTGWALVSVQPVLVAGRFSASTNDSRSGLLMQAAVATLFVGAMCSMIGAGIACIVVRGAVVLLFVPLVPLPALLCWLGYGALYNRGRIDLIKIPREG